MGLQQACRWLRRRRTGVIRRRTRSRPPKRWGKQSWFGSTAKLFFFFLILNGLGVWGAIASMRVLLVCPSDIAMHWTKKIWSISRYATQWSECSSKCSDMMGLQSRSDHQSLNTLVMKICLKSNLNYMTVSSTISIEGLRFSQDCVLWNHWWQRDCYKY